MKFYYANLIILCLDAICYKKMDSYVYEYITSHCRTEDSRSEMYGASLIFGGYLPGT